MSVEETSTEKNFLTYKGYPLLRKDDELYLGSMSDEYFIRMQVLHKQPLQSIEVADKIAIYKVSTKEGLSLMDSIVRSGERSTLLEALDLAYAWLNRKE